MHTDRCSNCAMQGSFALQISLARCITSSYYYSYSIHLKLFVLNDDNAKFSARPFLFLHDKDLCIFFPIIEVILVVFNPRQRFTLQYPAGHINSSSSNSSSYSSNSCSSSNRSSWIWRAGRAAAPHAFWRKAQTANCWQGKFIIEKTCHRFWNMWNLGRTPV